jgi:hypothetical protein
LKCGIIVFLDINYPRNNDLRRIQIFFSFSCGIWQDSKRIEKFCLNFQNRKKVYVRQIVFFPCVFCFALKSAKISTLLIMSAMKFVIFHSQRWLERLNIIIDDDRAFNMVEIGFYSGSSLTWSYKRFMFLVFLDPL